MEASRSQSEAKYPKVMLSLSFSPLPEIASPLTEFASHKLYESWQIYPDGRSPEL
jgi:hypothetical protein